MSISEHYIYEPLTVAQVDYRAIHEFGIAGIDLMERAAAYAFKCSQEYFPNIDSIQIFCGSGNNAGDAYLYACYAIDHGMKTSVIYLANPETLKGDAYLAYQKYKLKDGKLTQWNENIDINCDLIVDGIFGIGINRSVEGIFMEAIELINQNSTPVLSLDIPSGLSGENGKIMGSSVRADLTTTFVGKKIGLYINDGPEVNKRIKYSNLDIPEACFEMAQPILELTNESHVGQILQQRKKDSHKGNFGHVLVVGGNHGMGGAVRITAEAALRTGAGLVSVITTAQNAETILKIRPEIMTHALENDHKNLTNIIDSVDVVAIGPGLGQDQWAIDLYSAVLESNKPLILDADALNLLAKNPQQREDWVLTPHPGEAARLLACSNSEIQSNRLENLKNLYEGFGGVVLLKGQNTLVGCKSKIPYMISAGNPGMSTAGMGDLLTGIILGLYGQFRDQDLHLLTSVAALIHSTAGDRAAKSGERGIIATDLFVELKELLNP